MRLATLLLLIYTTNSYSFFSSLKSDKTCEVSVDFNTTKRVYKFNRVTDEKAQNVKEIEIYKTKTIKCTMKYFNDSVGLSLQCWDFSKPRAPGQYYQSDRSGVKEFPKAARLSYRTFGGDEYIEVDCD